MLIQEGRIIRFTWKATIFCFLLYALLVYYFLPDMRLLKTALLAFVLTWLTVENQGFGKQAVHSVSWRSCLLLLAVGILFDERALRGYLESFLLGTTMAAFCILLAWIGNRRELFQQIAMVSIGIKGLFLVLLYYMMVLPLPVIPERIAAAAFSLKMFLYPIGIVFFLVTLLWGKSRLHSSEEKFMLLCGAFVGLFGVQVALASGLAGYLLAKGKRCFPRIHF